MGIPRGTTPTFTLTFTDESLDLTQASHVIVSFRGGCGVIEKSDDDLVVSAQTISVYLDQAETLSLARGAVAIQVNWTYGDGSRAASNIVNVQLTENLVGRVIE